jgi:hypothetical protein
VLSGFADGWFDEGAVPFETGGNAGRTIEVKSWGDLYVTVGVSQT